VALLTASPETPLAVHCENDTPQIWGLLDIRPRFTVSLRVAGPGTLAAISDDDTLTVVHEGSVLDMQVGNKGENHTTRATGPLGLQILVAKLLGIERPFPDLFMLSSGLIMVICAMYRHRHGGAIAIVPADSDTWNASVEHRFAFDVSSSKRLHLRLQAVAAARVAADRSDIDINADLKVWNELNMRNEQRTCDEMLTNIGRLSAIDGVVVIRQDLTIVSFGAKLNCKPVDFSVMRLNAASVKHQDDCMITDLGGMRHQSAARFVHQHHDCMVVVSSQDGRLTLFAWVPDSDKVVEVGGLEHFLWGIDL
jgi:hypothetical protein